MIKSLLEFLQLAYSTSPFLVSLVAYALLASMLSASIKKHYKIYYTIFAVISFASLIPFLLRMLFGISLPFNLSLIPIFGQAMNEFSHAATMVHPLIVIIMYMGAFSPKIPFVGRLMSIRKELSIMVGFPVISHGLRRALATFPSGWNYFFNHEEFMQGPRVTSALGSGISSFVYVLGLVMFILFLVLWITSFDSVHKKMGGKSWKSLQKWSYGLYAMLFIHAMGLQIGDLISYNARQAQQASRQRTEQVEGEQGRSNNTQQQGAEREQARQVQQGSQNQQGQSQATQGQQQQRTRVRAWSFTSVVFSSVQKYWIKMIIYILVYGSYLFFRIRKSRADKAKKAAAKAQAKA
ncbi:MAG: hypothetical protein SNG97_04350 [Rikenellaceae bacterium]